MNSTDWVYKNPLPDSEILNKTVSQNSFLIFLEAAEASLHVVGNPYHVKMDILQNIKNDENIEEIRRIRNGNFIVKTNDKETAEKLLKLKKIATNNITARLSHENLLYSYVIRDVDELLPLESIAKDLQNQNITATHINRFTKKINETIVPLKMIKITVIGKQNVDKVKICFEIKNLTKYLNKPRQCHNCWRFNHVAKHCRSSVRCIKCGENHSNELCTSTEIKCPNCKLPHKGNDQKCEIYIKEQQILIIQAENNTTYSEARTQINKQSNPTTYASKLASQNTLENTKLNDLNTRVDHMEKAMGLLTKTIGELAITIKETNERQIKQTENLTQMFVNTMSRVSNFLERMATQFQDTDKNQNPRKRKSNSTSQKPAKQTNDTGKNATSFKHGNLIFENEDDSIDIDDVSANSQTSRENSQTC